MATGRLSRRVAGCRGHVQWAPLPRWPAALEHPTDRKVSRRAGATADAFFLLGHDDGPQGAHHAATLTLRGNARARYDDSLEPSPFPTIPHACAIAPALQVRASASQPGTRALLDVAGAALETGETAVSTRALRRELPGVAAARPPACCCRFRPARACCARFCLAAHLRMAAHASCVAFGRLFGHWWHVGGSV